MSWTERNRHLNTILQPVRYTYSFTGIFLTKLSKSTPKWRNVSRLIWTFIWQFSLFHGEIHTVNQRNTIKELFRLANEGDLRAWYTELNANLMWFSSFFFDTIAQYALLFTIPSTLEQLTNLLEPVKKLFDRLEYKTARTKISMKLVFVFIILVYNLGCAAFWYKIHPKYTFTTYDTLQNCIRIVNNQWTQVCPVLIYVASGELITFYYKAVANESKEKEKKLREQSIKISKKQANLIVEELFTLLTETIKPLQEAASLLQNHMAFALIASITACLTTLLSSSFYIFASAQSGLIFISYWEGCEFFDSTVRLFMIGYTADSIRLAGKDIIDHLRELRNYSPLLTSEQRTKITLFLVELRAHAKDREKNKLFGTLTVSRGMVLSVGQTVLAFLILIYQSK